MYAGVSPYATNSSTCQIIADGTDNTLGTAGQYVSIGVTNDGVTGSKGNVVVIVWYDGNNLMYAYNETPLAYVNQTYNYLPENEDDIPKASDFGWEGTTQLLSNGGEYCQIAVANDNSIHIAAYDSSNANLKYIYIPSYDGTPVICTVDSYLDVGEQLTIDVAQVGTQQIPYIGYWGAYPEKPRYAYIADPDKFYAATDAVTNGAEGNYYTGVWECTVVPSQSSVKDSRKINVGVWKYTKNNQGNLTNAGKLAYSRVGANNVFGTATGTNNYTSSTADTTTGTCYGNGTNNGVLAYVVAPTSSQYCAETAQKR